MKRNTQTRLTGSRETGCDLTRQKGRRDVAPATQIRWRTVGAKNLRQPTVGAYRKIRWRKRAATDLFRWRAAGASANAPRHRRRLSPTPAAIAGITMSGPALPTPGNFS